MGYLQMNTFLHTTKMIVLPSFLRHKLKMLSKCCVFKVRQYINLTVQKNSLVSVVLLSTGPYVLIEK